jgi:hypothetical protein
VHVLAVGEFVFHGRFWGWFCYCFVVCGVRERGGGKS